MANPFDQFDRQSQQPPTGNTAAANPFDQFDNSTQPQQAAASPSMRSTLDFLSRPGTPLGMMKGYAERVGSNFSSGMDQAAQGIGDIVERGDQFRDKQGKVTGVATGVPRIVLGGMGSLFSPVTAAISPVLSPVIEPIAGAVDRNIGKPIEDVTGYPSDITTPAILQGASYGAVKGAGALVRGAVGGRSAGASTRQAISEFEKIGEKPTLAQATSGSNSPLQYLGRLLEFTPGGYLPFRGRIKSQLEAAAKRIETALQSAGKTSQLDAGVALQAGAQRFADKVSRTQGILENRLERAVPGKTVIAPNNTLQALNDLTDIGTGSEVGAATVSGTLKSALSQFQNDVAQSGGVTFKALKAFRTKLGAKTNSGQSLIGDVSAGDAKQLYKALTKDMEDAATQAGQGNLVKLRNSYYSKRKSEIEDVFDKRIKQDAAPEQIFRSFRDSDFSQSERIMRQLNPKQRRTVAGQVLHEMGKPSPGEAAGDTAAFSLDRFDTNMAKFNGTSSKGGGRLDAFFNMSGTQDLRAALREVSAVAERFKGAEKFLKNPSQSAVVGTQLGALGAIGGLAWADPIGALYLAGMTYGVPYALARGGNSATFIRLIAGIGKQNKSTLPGHILRMSAWVQQNPEYAPALKDMLDKAYQQPEATPNNRDRSQ